MTTNLVKDIYGRYLDWHKENPIKKLEELTVGDMLRVHKDEVELARDLEAERQVDLNLIVAENN